MSKNKIVHEDGYTIVTNTELDASPSPTATYDAGVWIDPKHEKALEMEMVAFTKFVPTIYSKEELKDVKYTVDCGYLIVTHPAHPVYRVNMRTYEWEEVEPLL